MCVHVQILYVDVLTCIFVCLCGIWHTCIFVCAYMHVHEFTCKYFIYVYTHICTYICEYRFVIVYMYIGIITCMYDCEASGFICTLMLMCGANVYTMYAYEDMCVVLSFVSLGVIKHFGQQ